ncbi:MAG TPA: YdeI/OmpD-associated family protein [Pyrinomonadaceae bacterium]|nr:YdeI/OmpD-associated family protein [Pyrinomonadaceae bacterium]
MKEITVSSKVIRHQPQFSRLVTIPLEKIAPWKLDATTTVEGTINGIELGRRSLKRWDERTCWWIDLPDPLCKKAGIEVGDDVKLTLRLASEELPPELQQLLEENAVAKQNWAKLTAAQQRMLREEIFAAKTPATRLKRATKQLI